MEKYLNEYRENLEFLGKSKITIRNYIGTARKFIREQGIKSVEELDNLDRRWWLSHMALLKKTLKPSTINTFIKQMSSFLDYLVLERLIEENCLKHMQSLSTSNEEFKEKVMTDEQAKAIISASDNFPIREKCLIYLLMNIAPRIGEVSRIRIKDIDLDNNKIWIRGKGHNDNVSRYSNFNDKTKDLLIRLMVEYGLDREYLFVNYKGEQLSEQSLRKMWYEVCESIGIEGITPHQCRHFLGSTLISKGVPTEKVAQVLGHSSIKTTERYYIKPKDDMNDILSKVDIF